ncbi:hypothetical protein HNR22_003863 [Micromonospora jinlongensis]|uniref:Uncharacterized protein n=1 Tax=Micromonospora jinlongensis TaxID=1287877 RepID=A0A7Y9X2N3_9ACTN|nr:hypothetical protein [Micromonospora jinlongensis]
MVEGRPHLIHRERGSVTEIHGGAELDASPRTSL